MDDFVVVLNAGSSSLKFCAYSRPPGDAWRLAGRGQIEGIGTSPRSRPRTATAPESSTKRSATAVRDARARSMRWPSGCASSIQDARIVGVGHRVVHGGADFPGPVVVTPMSSSAARAGAARAAASTAQPRRDRGGERTPAARAASGVLRHQLSSRPRRGGRSGAAAEGDPSRGRAALRLSRAVVRVHRLGAAAGRAEIASGRVIVAHLGSGASLCAYADGKGIDSTLGFTALDGLCMGTRPGSIDPGVVLYLFQTLGLDAQGGRDDALQEVRAARHLRHQQRHARSARQRAIRPRVSPSTISSIASPRRSARWPPCSAASTASSSPPASASAPRRSASAFATRLPGSGSRSIAAPTSSTGRAFRAPDSTRRSVGRPDQRGARDRPPHRTVAWIDRGPRLAREKDRHHDGDRSTDEDRPAPAKRPGRDSSPASGRPTSTSAISSSRTTRRTTATSRSSRRPRRAR